jgi:ABC-2 type transport system ATP-binding protein
MTQRFSYYEDLTIRENLDFVARMYRLDRRRARVDQALEELGLADRSRQLAGSLSGGWKQRLALAACLLHTPQLLLLDEPTAGVDPKARRDFWDEIRRLSARGVTVLVSTHYMDEAVQCDFITYIAYGKKLIDGRSSEIPSLVGLTTWRVEGPDLAALEGRLKQEPGVEQVARFGAVLHVSGTDRERLEATVKRLEAEGGYRWTLQVAGLEEAFIYLMAGARDNFAADTPPEIAA